MCMTFGLWFSCGHLIGSGFGVIVILVKCILIHDISQIHCCTILVKLIGMFTSFIPYYENNLNSISTIYPLKFQNFILGGQIWKILSLVNSLFELCGVFSFKNIFK